MSIIGVMSISESSSGRSRGSINISSSDDSTGSSASIRSNDMLFLGASSSPRRCPQGLKESSEADGREIFSFLAEHFGKRTGVELDL